MRVMVHSGDMKLIGRGADSFRLKTVTGGIS